MTLGRLAEQLPDFPWDVLAPYGVRAAEHPQGIVDLSVGTPVDPTPELVQAALGAASDASGYPPTAGTDALRREISGWLARRLGVTVPRAAILPTIGSKELVASLPHQLGVRPGDVVVIPRLAYPTYAVGALLAGATVEATDRPEEVRGARLVWLNSPANPTGAVLPPDRLAEIVQWARATGTILVSDECYVELGWEVSPTSILHPDVSGGSHDQLLAVHSLSKRSNLAGYRFGFVTGDPRLVDSLLAVRKHQGLIVPAPVQSAAAAAFADDAHVDAQRAIYARRRNVLRSAVVDSGFRVDHSEAGLYLWITRDEPCWDTVSWFADRGVLVTPGEFYGRAGERHVRIALTVADDRVDAVRGRLAGP